MKEINFEITENFGKLSGDSGKTSVELNKVRWGVMNAMFDLRRWGTKDGQKVPYKGLVLNSGELLALRDILNNMKLGGDGG